ncbi:MAG: O-antigen export system permease protein RfbA [Nitrospira sp.]|nr:MAG: O-antigen export system permease protein RfbA [Nitrospira sp.]
MNWEQLWDLVVILTQKEIKSRYKNSALGYVWSVANPLLFAIVYYVVFGQIMKVPVENYALFLMAGLLPWHWLANSLSAAPNIFLANATLIKKVRFPRHVLVVSYVLNEGIHFVLSIPVIVGFLLVNGMRPSWSWLAGVPLLLVAEFLIVYGMAVTVASLNLFFRDLERLTALVVTVLFFLTPITYASAMAPGPYRSLLSVNPVAALIEGWRELFMHGELSWLGVGSCYLSALATLLVGSVVYWRMSPKFAEVL